MSEAEKVMLYRVELEQLLSHLREARNLYEKMGKERNINFKISRYGRILVLLNLWIYRLNKILRWR